MLKRIIIVGTSGSGKTTLAGQLAAILSIRHIELDSLFWQENWTPTPDEQFIETVKNALDAAPNGWVIDGNYRKIHELTWKQSDTVIWLDYSIWTIYRRVISRTIKRVFSREKLWDKNYETVHTSFFSKESVIWWAHSTYAERKRFYASIMQSNQYPHLIFLRFTSPKQTDKWLNLLLSAS